MKPRHALLALALALAAALAAFGDRGAGDDVVEPAARAPHAGARPHRPATAPDTAVLRLVPRDELMAADEGDGLFRSQNWNPPPPKPAPPPPPPPPSAPPLPFAYIGKAYEHGVWEVFLARGETTYAVKGGEVLDGTYRVESVKPPLMRLTYLPLKQLQQMNIGATE